MYILWQPVCSLSSCFSFRTNLTLFLTRRPRWFCASLLKILLLDKKILAVALATLKLVWVGLCILCAKVLRHFTVCKAPVGCYYCIGQSTACGIWWDYWTDHPPMHKSGSPRTQTACPHSSSSIPAGFGPSLKELARLLNCWQLSYPQGVRKQVGMQLWMLFAGQSAGSSAGDELGIRIW